MDFYTSITSVENTINKLHIHSDFHSGFIYNLYHHKQDITGGLFYQYHIPLLKDVDHPELI